MIIFENVLQLQGLAEAWYYHSANDLKSEGV